MEHEQYHCTQHEHKQQEPEVVAEVEELEEEEEEDGGLERRKFFPKSKDISSFSSYSNGGGNGVEHSKGVFSVVNGTDGSHIHKEEEQEEDGENGNHLKNDEADSEAVGLGIVAEIVGAAAAATNGDSGSHKINSVYFDKQQGNEVNGSKNGDHAGLVLPKNHVEEDAVIPNGISDEVNNGYTKTADDKVPTSSSESQATYVTKFDDKETNEKEDPKIKEEIDQLKDYDVEAVLEKQETHDLFCPNCHSCITKRVILKKRKRTVPNLENKAECHNLVDTVSSKPVESVAQEVNQGDQPNATTEIVSEEQPDDNYNGEREPEVFRCLSCFSFFIPSGRCFNLFRNVGSAREHVTPQNYTSIPSSESQNLSSIPASNSQNSSNVSTSSKSNWLFSLFTPNKGKITSDASIEHSRTTRTEQHHSTPATSNIQTSSVNGLPEAPVADTASAAKTEPWTENSIKSNTVSGNKRSTDKKLIDSLFQNDLSSVESDSTLPVSFSEHDSVSVAAAATEIHLNGREPAKDPILNSYDGKPKFPDPTTLLTPLLDKSPREVASYSSPRQGTQALVQSIASDVASYNQGSAIDAIIPSKQDPILNGKENNKGGGDVTVVVDQEAVEFTTSWTEDHAPVEAAIIADSHTTSLGEQEMAEIGEPKEWEILKSIVYGGLVESITSLGIVTSAVGSGTAPLNIIALGLANLVGGLVILGNNLWELKDDHSGSGTNQMEINDRYQELLGRRSNFLLHVVVAVLSFLIFGSIPIIVYGVLINKNYYTEVKLAAVVTASLLCVILLAIGKVYTKPQPKAYIKTASYYVTMALVVSGISYIVGNLVQDLLEKLTHSDSGFAIAMSNADTKTAWMSY
ncbi:membrane protein of ER body-like protein isoform X2 [Arachis stenosperma]|uniref:membrane protein of ER body-like protein isoform X2 n=1 Tax=Arachis stenosperma TaxID=217475 RepID=UPI0025ACCCAD|nr:membrane protein of ER body-like protein isoform X2 [Arachis stenosperma]